MPCNILSHIPPPLAAVVRAFLALSYSLPVADMNGMSEGLVGITVTERGLISPRVYKLALSKLLGNPYSNRSPILLPTVPYAAL